LGNFGYFGIPSQKKTKTNPKIIKKNLQKSSKIRYEPSKNSQKTTETSRNSQKSLINLLKTLENPQKIFKKPFYIN
jgi:hypothetical protein